MSVIVPLASIVSNKDLTSSITADLTVKSVVDSRSLYGQQTTIQAFDVFQDGSKEFACLPLGYFYHHLETRVPKLNFGKLHTTKTFAFQGQLLERQVEIEQEALDILQTNKSILLCLHTGFGKTIFTLYLLSRLGMRSIVLCHRSIIMQQWVDSVHKYLPQCKVELLSLPKYKKHGDTLYDDVDVLVTNVVNVPKLPRSMYKRFGCVVVDEVHTVCTSQFSKALFYLTPSYLIGLSATPFRSDGMDRLLELYLGPFLIHRPMQRFFNAYKLDTNFVPKIEQTVNGDLNWNSVLMSQAKDLQRNHLICRLAWYFDKRNILILVKRKDHALLLKKMLVQLGEDADCFINIDKTVNYSCRVLIATYSKGGVGFDHPKLDMLITGADVEENFMQYLGRIFRRDDVLPIYVDLRDKMPIMLKHSSSRLKICKEVGASVLEFDKVFKCFEEYTSKLF